MRKKFLAVLLFAALGTTYANAGSLNSLTNATSRCCYFYSVVNYITQTENGCTVTYKVTTTYMGCIVICVQKTKVSSCGCGNNGGGGTGGGGDNLFSLFSNFN